MKVQETEAKKNNTREQSYNSMGIECFVQPRLRIILCQFGRFWITGWVQTTTSVVRIGEVAKCFWGPDSWPRSLPGR